MEIECVEALQYPLSYHMSKEAALFITFFVQFAVEKICYSKKSAAQKALRKGTVSKRRKLLNNGMNGCTNKYIIKQGQLSHSIKLMLVVRGMQEGLRVLFDRLHKA